jgi:hypothetical protein
VPSIGPAVISAQSNQDVSSSSFLSFPSMGRVQPQSGYLIKEILGNARAIVLARIPKGPYSRATCLMRVSTPAFAEAACA